MAGAYVALVSLMHVLNRVQHPACPVSFDKSQIQSLSDKVNSLINFLEADSYKTRKDLEKAMIDAAFAAEDLIESYLVDRIRKRSTGSEEEEAAAGSYSLISQDLDKAIQNMDFIVQQAMEVKEKTTKLSSDVKALPFQQVGFESHLVFQNEMEVKAKDHREIDQSSVRVSLPVSPSEPVETLGFEDDDIHQLVGRLIFSDHSSRQIIPIIGMRGIGKTTLARGVFEHPCILSYFDVKAWVCISEKYTVGTIISTLLHQFGYSVTDQLGNEQLGVMLYKHLFGRRYLIVLDDVWDSKLWGKIMKFLPDNNNKSRILLTTRLSDVAFSHTSNPYEMKLLNDDKSWRSLSANVFEDSNCPPELEYFGKKIAQSCKGLPLVIILVAGFLKFNWTQEYWEQVENSIRHTYSSRDPLMGILSLSYHQMPIYLKPCFLYMVTFPEGYEIRVSEVIRLWVADGLLKPNVDKTLEDIALDYINGLIIRNLVRVTKRDLRGEIKCLAFHDLLRNLCIIEAQKERFLYVAHGVVDFPEIIESHRRLVADSFPHGKQKKGFARSLIRFGNWGLLPEIEWLHLVRVFVSSHQRNKLDDIMQLVNVRFLKFTMNEYMLIFLNLSRNEHPLSLFSTISLLWNLETLIVDVAEKAPEGYSLPPEIWKLQHIKHLIFSKEVILPDPPTSDTDFVFENLQTLKIIRVLSGDVLARIPNIRKLGICYEQKESTEVSPWFGPLVQCHKLEALAISSVFTTRDLKRNMFPVSLKKLTLCNCRIPWGSMKVVGSLPNLEVLKIGWAAFVGKEWESTKGEFQSLKILSVEECNLVSWLVEDCLHFPCLERLRLGRMWWLEEIPMAFGESPTLESIHLEDCRKSAVISAKEILEEEQQIFNNLSVKVVHFLNSKQGTTELEMKLEMELKQELESMTNDYFQVTFEYRD